jgi:hypothetical protein
MLMVLVAGHLALNCNIALAHLNIGNCSVDNDSARYAFSMPSLSGLLIS